MTKETKINIFRWAYLINMFIVFLNYCMAIQTNQLSGSTFLFDIILYSIELNLPFYFISLILSLTGLFIDKQWKIFYIIFLSFILLIYILLMYAALSFISFYGA